MLIIVALINYISLGAQQIKIDSLNKLIAGAKTDTAKIDLYEKLGDAYRSTKKMDSCILSFQQALKINEKNNYSLQHQCWNMAALDYILFEMGNYTESLKYAFDHLALSKKINDTAQVGSAYLVFGHDYRELGDYKLSLNNYFNAYHFWEIFHKGRHEPPDNTFTILCISQVYLKMNKIDSALLYALEGNKFGKEASHGLYILLSERILGDIYSAKDDEETALNYYRQYIPDYAKYQERNRDLCFVLNNMAKIFQERNQNDSAVLYAKKALSNAEEFQDQQSIYDASQLLYILNDSLNDESQALQYLKIAETAKDSMTNIEKIRQIQSLTFNEQIREKEQAETEVKAAAKTRLIIIIASLTGLLITFLVWNRIKQLKLKYKAILEQKELEKLKAKHEKEMLELEAKALRAQMNPHFIFNCMNSIKALIQEHDEDKAISYLTTFSKLIRTIFNNSDKREISLFDEIETCKLYTQLESMRFENRFKYDFNIDETVDMKSISVPALIIQPYIENAIWHGIMPNENGGSLNVCVKNENEAVCCIVEDDGIGREMSKQNKFKTGNTTHNSKGMHLTQSRIDLDNLINNRHASLEIIDKKDETGNATGTKVILIFKKY